MPVRTLSELGSVADAEWSPKLTKKYIMNEKEFHVSFFQTTDKWAMPLRTKKCLAIHGLDSSWNDPGPLALKVRKKSFFTYLYSKSLNSASKVSKKSKICCNMQGSILVYSDPKNSRNYAIFPDFLHHARLPNTKNFEQTRTYRISHYSNLL